jgi:hypothetical protein
VAKDLRAKAAGFREARIEPDPPATVCAGVPLLLFGECEPRGEGAVDLQWSGGRLAVPVKLEAGRPGDTLRLLRGSRLITDLESRMPAPPHGGPLAPRQEHRLDRHLEDLSRRYGLASRAMALVAVVERAGDHPGAPPETSVVPVGLPQDMEFEGVFQRARPAAPAKQVLTDVRFRASDVALIARATACAKPTADDSLMELAAELEPDGGMPGEDETDRVLATLRALIEFAAEGHSPSHGPYRRHLARMIAFVERRLPGGLTAEQADTARRLIEAIRRGQPVSREGWAI